MARSVATAVLCLMLVLPTWSQTGKAHVDSILAHPDDTAKVLGLSDLCFAYRRVNGDSALLFGERALALAKALRYLRGEAQACNDLAIIHIDRSAYGAADSLLRIALTIRTALHDSAGMGAIHNKLGNSYQSRSMFEQALAENFLALRIFERIGPPAKEGLILNNIANLQNNLRRHADALATQQRALVLFEAIGDTNGLATSWGNMANAHLALGDTSEAERLYTKAAGHFRAKGLRRELGVQLHNLAGVVLARGDGRRATALFSEALAIREAIGEKKAIASSLTGLGRTLMLAGDRQRALPLFRRALHLSREVGARNEEMQALLDLALVHAELDHGDSTYWYHDRYVHLRDSVFNADMSARFTELETRYGTEKKEREILEQRAKIAVLARQAERRRFWLAVAGGGIGVLGFASLLVFQVQRRKARAARDAAVIAEREQGLKALVENTENERRRIAHELHDGVGQQISGLRFRLEDAAGRDPALGDLLSIADEAGKEVRDLAHQMMPRALETQGLVPAVRDMLDKALTRPGMSHQFEAFGLDARLPHGIETGVYRIAQELVSNVIRHADASQVNVQLLRNKGHLVLLVEDNGRGMDPARATDGLGLRGMRDRARVLHGSLTFAAGHERGTVATLRVPLDHA